MMKSFIHYIFAIVTLTTFLQTSLFASLDYVIENQTHVFEQIIQIDQKMDLDSFTYYCKS